MLKRFFPKLNNKAFTLIEIVLAVALLAVVTVAIGSVIISTQNNTTRMFTEAELQQQLAEVQQTVHDEILATSAGIKYWAKEDKNDDFELIEQDEGDEYEKLVAFYNLDAKDFILSKTYYLYNSKDKTLKKAELEETLPKANNSQGGSFQHPVDNDIEDTLSLIEKWTLVAENLEHFSINVSTYSINKLIAAELEVKQENNSYPTDETIYVRNKIAINSDLTIEGYHVIELTKPTLENIKFIYDGQEHGPVELNYFERYMIRVNEPGFETTLTAKDVGTYYVKYRLKDKESTCWIDENGNTSVTDVMCVWTIEKKTVSLTWGTTSWVYDNATHATTCEIGLVEDVDEGKCNVELINNHIGPSVGTVECSAKLVGPRSNNYQLPTNSTAILEITAARPSVDITTVDTTYDNTGGGRAQTMVSYKNLVGGTLRFYISTDPTAPTDSQVNNEECKATNAGTYYVWYRIIASNPNYSTTEAIKIDRPAVIYRSPTAKYGSTDHTYDGNEKQGVTWLYAVPSGVTSAVDAGSYVGYLVPDSNHLWEDSTDRQITLPWKIEKAAGRVTLSEYSGSITYPSSGGFTITGNISNGALSVDSANTSVATATLSGMSVALNPGTSGNQTVKITVTSAETPNYKAATAEYSLTVNKGVLEVTASGYSGAYDGQPHGISVQCTNVNGVTITYSTDGTNYSTTNPTYTDFTNGAKTVYYKVSKAGYNDKTGSATVNITKANGKVVLDATSGTIIYPNKGTFNVTENLSGGTLSVSTSNSATATASISNKKVTVSSGTTSGKATITVTSAETTNYKAATATYTVTVGKGTLNPTVSGFEGPYDRTAHGITVACNGATITYGTTEGNYDKTSSPTYTDTGTYTVYFKVTKAGYNDYTGSATVKITQATGTISLSETSGTTTYPTNKTVTIVTNSDGAISATSSASGTATGSVSGVTLTVKPGTTSGKATITVSVAETKNYSACSATYTITVNAGTLSVTANSYSGAYDGKAHGISVTCATSGVKIEYSKDGTNYSETNPTWKDVTSAQTVYYRVSKAGYTTVTGSKTVTITKANNTLQISKSSGTITYPGSDTITVTKNTSGGTISVKSSNTNVATVAIQSDGSIKITAGTTSGSATITVTSAATGNYNSASATYTATVQYGELSVTANNYNKAYDGQAHGISVTCTTSGVKIEYSKDGTNYSETNPTWTDVTSAQTVYYRVSKAGYTTVTGSKTVTITKANGSVVLSKTSGSIKYPNNTTTKVTTNTSGGKITVTSSNTNIATASVGSDGVTITITAGTTAGSATITVKSAATTNYKEATATYTVTVGAGTMSITLTKYDAQYDGKAHGITVSGAPTGATIKYCTTEKGTYSTTAPTLTNVGNQQVYVKVTATGYAEWSGSSTITISRSRTAVFELADPSDFSYDGKSHTGITHNDKIDFTSGYTTITAKEPNKYIVKATPKANYAWADGTYGELTLEWNITGTNWKVGDPCRVKDGAKWANDTWPADFVYNTQYYILHIENNGIMVIGPDKDKGYVSSNVTGRIHKDNLIYGTSK